MLRAITGLFCITLTTTCLAHPCHLLSGKTRDTFSFNGDTRCDKGTSTLVEVNGRLKLTNTQITDTLFAKGESFIKNADINVGNFVGQVNALNSSFKGELELDTKKASLINCITHNITIDTSKYTVSQLILDGTKVKGNIRFTDKKGLVRVRNNAKIEGRIIGGTLMIDDNSENNSPQNG